MIRYGRIGNFVWRIAYSTGLTRHGVLRNSPGDVSSTCSHRPRGVAANIVEKSRIKKRCVMVKFWISVEPECFEAIGQGEETYNTWMLVYPTIERFEQTQFSEWHSCDSHPRCWNLSRNPCCGRRRVTCDHLRLQHLESRIFAKSGLLTAQSVIVPRLNSACDFRGA